LSAGVGVGQLRSIIETCEPRPDVLSGGLADSHFAAQLDQVVRSPDAYPIYGDPGEFFALTFPTAGLKRLLGRTFGRLSHAKVEGAEHGVIRAETSFGGGKTHSLMAVYHLAKGARPANLNDFLDPAILPERCQVAAVVADTLDPENGLVTNGIRSYTMWGEIAAQLGPDAYATLRASDEGRTAPGKATWAEIVGDMPTIIIIDEIAQHLRQLSSSGNPDVRRMAGAIPAFLKNLFELAVGTPSVVVLLTLATAADAYGAETDELSTLLDELEGGFATALADTQSVLARSGHVIKPAEDDEMGEILKRRPSPASMLGLPPRLATPTAPTTRTCWPRVNSWPEVPRRR
jgi:predicted AAA+ superfamily ATPase